MTDSSDQKCTQQRLEPAPDFCKTDPVQDRAGKVFYELGYRDSEITRCVADIFSLIHPDDLPSVRAALNGQSGGTGESYRCEFRLRAKDGAWIWYASLGKFMGVAGDNPKRLFIGATFNVNERKQKTVELDYLTRTLKLLSTCNKMLIQAASEQEFIDAICKLAVETGDYTMAWIGYAEHDAARSVTVRAHYGFNDGYLDNLRLTWQDSLLGQGPAGTSIRTGTTVVNQDYASNPSMEPWYDAAIKSGYKSSIAVPVIIQNQIVGVFNAYTGKQFAFEPLEILLLEELAGILSYGIDSLRTRVQNETAQLALKKESEKNLALLRNASDGIHIIDELGNVVEFSDSFCAMLGYTRSEMAVMHVSHWDVNFSDVGLRQKIQEQLNFHGRSQFESRHVRKDGVVLDVELSGHPLILDGRNLIFNSSRDITERKKIEASLRQKQQEIIDSENQSRDLLNNLRTAIIVYSPLSEITFSNARASELLALSFGQIQGKVAIAPGWRIIDEQECTLKRMDYPANKVIATLKPMDACVVGVVVPGKAETTWILVYAFPEFKATGELLQVVVQFDDITAIKLADQKIHQLAFYDDLTRLPNRRVLMDRLNSALAISTRSNKYGALLFIDLDRFKMVNDVFGHDYGDLLLIEVARRIQSGIRAEDTVVRLGGDEFVVLIVEIHEQIEVASQKTAILVDKLRCSLNVPYHLRGNVQHSSPSIGVSLFCHGTETAESLLKQADMAMYKAKEAGRNAFRFFNPDMQLAVETRSLLESDLRHAITSQQLYLNFQIQVDSAHRPMGAEALVRWKHPVKGLVPPMQFIPIAEESSLIINIGDWVLNEACRQLKMWSHARHTGTLTLAVNVSAQQFRQADFVKKLKALIHHHGIKADRLKLELTESVVLDDVSDVVAKMHVLKKLGVQLSMDDFGTGYSSLAYLKQLPLDQVKIDQSFVRDLITDPNDAVMVKTIIDLANNFRLQVIAEGVESVAQLEFLKRHGCMAFQGYLFSRPVSVAEFEVLVSQAYTQPGPAD